MNVTKADIVESIATSTGISKTDIKAVVEGVFAAITGAVAEGNKVELRGFGVFGSKNRKARTARNPRTGAPVDLKERYIPSFKASSEYIRKVVEEHP